MAEIRNWFGKYLPIFVGKFGWQSALITFVVLVAVVAGVLWLFDVPVGAILERWLT